MAATPLNRNQTLNITKLLYDAALDGDKDSFQKLLQQEPLILDRCIIEKSSAYTQSLLHLASAKGHLPIIETLVNAKPEMCFAYDQDGNTPIHVAAANGKIGALKLFLNTVPLALWKKTTKGETVLHLCVIFNQPAALEILVESTDENDLLNCQDSDGNTVLHLAVAAKQTQMVEYIVGPAKAPKKIENAVNKNRMTALDIYLKQTKKGKHSRDLKIETYLKRAKAKGAKETLCIEAEKTWLENQRSAVMVVASLIATMAFQAGINPPGGVWQDTVKDNPVQDNPVQQDAGAGETIWSYYVDKTYKKVIISNTVGLISSLSVILLLISGLPFRRHLLSILRIILFISVTTMSLTYLLAISYVTRSGDGKFGEVISNSVAISILTWITLVTIIFIGNGMRFIKKVVGWRGKQAIKYFCRNYCCITRNDDKDVGKNGLAHLGSGDP